MAKSLTFNQFKDAIDYMDLIPVSVSTAVNTQPVHAWDEALEVQQDDIAGYGVYVLNKILQSIVGSVTAELTKVETNRRWLDDNKGKSANGDAIARRNDWINTSMVRASGLKDLFEYIKNKQTELLVADGVRYDVGYAEDAEWRPQEFVPFPYNSEETIRKAKARNLTQASIDARVKLDIMTHELVCDAFKTLTATPLPSPQNTITYFTYVQKMLQACSSYYDRCIDKKNFHYKACNDKLSLDAEARANNLALVCKALAKILKNSHEDIPDGQVH